MRVGKTERGFELIEFTDRCRQECSLQQSSAIDDTQRGLDNPGSSMVWLGSIEDPMHLVAWLATGSLRTEEAEP